MKKALEETRDLKYKVYASPIGELHTYVSDKGVQRISFAADEVDDVVDLTATTYARRAELCDELFRELDKYFAGTLQVFHTPCDFPDTTLFRKEVLHALQHVRYGHTQSYKELAQQSGKPRAIRAAASVCATNPIAIIIPCHRIVHSDGEHGEYYGGRSAKRYLLDLERTHVRA